ncbi:Protein aubergine [Orchesella cincta]|uniref:Protein aubergine n=1 Tax=Orchesella cincta TaxID=48709 RepID=A0A1D2M5Z9_ORCCI|nr:Protein aubergine [Orchesella cincta]
MYRDGVGEGQLKAVYNTELTILTEGLMKMYATEEGHPHSSLSSSYPNGSTLDS